MGRWIRLCGCRGISEGYSRRDDPAGRGADIFGSTLEIVRGSAYDSFTMRTMEESGVLLIQTWATAPFLSPGECGVGGGLPPGDRAPLPPWNA